MNTADSNVLSISSIIVVTIDIFNTTYFFVRAALLIIMLRFISRYYSNYYCYECMALTSGVYKHDTIKEVKIRSLPEVTCDYSAVQSQNAVAPI